MTHSISSIFPITDWMVPVCATIRDFDFISIGAFRFNLRRIKYHWNWHIENRLIRRDCVGELIATFISILRVISNKFSLKSEWIPFLWTNLTVEWMPMQGCAHEISCMRYGCRQRINRWCTVARDATPQAVVEMKTNKFKPKANVWAHPTMRSMRMGHKRTDKIAPINQFKIPCLFV